MLRNLNDLENTKISAMDGEIGHVKDFYFEDDAWVVRYFVVDTGTWLASRKVLISPISVHRPDWLERTLSVSITKDQVKLLSWPEKYRPAGAFVNGTPAIPFQLERRIAILHQRLPELFKRVDALEEQVGAAARH